MTHSRHSHIDLDHHGWSCHEATALQYFRVSVYLPSAVNLCLTVLWSEIPNTCYSTVEAFFKLVYLQILDKQLISVSHDHGNFPKVLPVVWLDMFQVTDVQFGFIKV